MTDILTNLGLRANTASLPIPSYTPHFIIGNFILAHALTSLRGTKILAGIDNNVCPREDLDRFGPAAVKSGKMTQAQLDTLKRRQAAHANAVENYPFFLGAMIFAELAGLEPAVVNRYAVVYTVIRTVYAVLYARVEKKVLSYLRSVCWWVGNITCFRLIWFAGKALEAKRS
ncbi:hypothetical protein K402DRAFT_349176 [Aulographum hederae CBS 113979]|uniref:Membrane-associated proteins in eicosanoid and glutathione metabolism n=1 Tax=Aulographum hederae CBS 113979 TaxID=1176131 RepID=A0A6G1HA31_9PEZI|nr:hypothetical protein K402DRAFT_349176 [Aulographum hederae CBS 113979]